MEEWNGTKKHGLESEKDSEGMTRRGFLKMAGAALTSALVHEHSINRFGDGIEVRENPSELSLVKTFNLLRGERVCNERRRHVDDKGTYLWELEFQIKGGTAEFGYMRKGRHPVGGSALTTKIYLTFFDESGMPEGGFDVAEFKDGKWEIDLESLQDVD